MWCKCRFGRTFCKIVKSMPLLVSSMCYSDSDSFTDTFTHLHTYSYTHTHVHTWSAKHALESGLLYLLFVFHSLFHRCQLFLCSRLKTGVEGNGLLKVGLRFFGVPHSCMRFGPPEQGFDIIWWTIDWTKWIYLVNYGGSFWGSRFMTSEYKIEKDWVKERIETLKKKTTSKSQCEWISLS